MSRVCLRKVAVLRALTSESPDGVDVMCQISAHMEEHCFFSFGAGAVYRVVMPAFALGWECFRLGAWTVTAQ